MAVADRLQEDRAGADHAVAAPSSGPRLPRPVQTLWYGLDPYGFFRRAHRRYGDAFQTRLLAENWVVLSDPAVVHELIRHGPDDLNSGEANLSLRPILGTRNVLLLDGDEHLRRRKVVLPPLHGDRMRAYQGVMEEIARRELASWPAAGRLAVLPRVNAMTFEVILRAVFGVDEAPRLRRLGDSLRAWLGWTTDVRRGLVFAAMGPERLMAMRSFRRQEAVVEREVYDQIALRRADPGLAEREDILSLLLQATYDDGSPLSDRDLRDELLTLLLAGHETTAALLAWAVHELARAPTLQDRLAEGEEGLADAVVSETLRLWPPVPLVLRRLRVPLEIGGRRYPAGTTLTPCMLVLHRRADLWPEPEAFRPERFLGGQRPAPGSYLPFGGGVRRCVGAAFASFEARIFLTELARALRLSAPARRERVWRRGIVLVPARGARVSAQAR